VLTLLFLSRNKFKKNIAPNVTLILWLLIFLSDDAPVGADIKMAFADQDNLILQKNNIALKDFGSLILYLKKFQILQR
jgi:hypothetical protein